MNKENAALGVMIFAHGHANVYCKQIKGFKQACLVSTRVPRPFINDVRGLTGQTISAGEGRAATGMLAGAQQSSADRRLAELSY